MKVVIIEKHPELVKENSIFQNNDRLQVYLVSRQNLSEFGWGVFIHQPYSSDIADLDDQSL